MEDSRQRAALLTQYASAAPQGSPERAALEEELAALRRHGIDVGPIPESPYAGLEGFMHNRGGVPPGFLEATAEVLPGQRSSLVIPPQNSTAPAASLAGAAPPPAPAGPAAAVRPAPRRRFPHIGLRFNSPQQALEFATTGFKLGRLAWKALRGMGGK